jgi:hypothetical protein
MQKMQNVLNEIMELLKRFTQECESVSIVALPTNDKAAREREVIKKELLNPQAEVEGTSSNAVISPEAFSGK